MWQTRTGKSRQAAGIFSSSERRAESGIVMSFAGGISGLINGSTESVCGECGNPSQFCDDEIAVLSARHQKVH